MLTFRYHFGTIIAIFIALGLGMMIGGTVGQKWIASTEQELIQLLVKKVDKVTERNQSLEISMTALNDQLKNAQKQVDALLSRSIHRVLEGKKVLWIHPPGVSQNEISMAIQAAGGVLDESLLPLANLQPPIQADIVLFSSEGEYGVENSGEVIETFGQNSNVHGLPVVVFENGSKTSYEELSTIPRRVAAKVNFNQPEDIIQFVDLLGDLLKEEQPDANIGRRTGF